MQAVKAPLGAKCIDTYSIIDSNHAKALLGSGIQVVARYTDNCSPGELKTLLDSGLLVFFVVSSPSNGYIPTPAMATSKHMGANSKLKSLGIPNTVSVFVDLEGMGGDSIAQLNYADAAAACFPDYTAGVYVGAGVGLTGKELYSIPAAHGYWKSLSQVWDRFGQIAEPTCGWQLVQGYPPNIIINGVQVDIDFITTDYHNRRVICVSN